VEGSADVAWGIFRDVAVATQLGAQLLEVSVILGELAARRLPEGWRRLNKRCAAACPQVLAQCTGGDDASGQLEPLARAPHRLAQSGEIQHLDLHSSPA
jgi:hypothetical protein